MELARPARDEDHPACRGLLDELLAGADGMRGGPTLVGQQTSETLLARWTGPDAQLFVGEFEGVVVGVLGVSAAPHTSGSSAGPRGLVEGCYVELDARGVGVGSALLQAALAWCQEQGCREVDALALPGDRATKQGLEAAGFTARLLTLSRRLD
jgi:GNAT superfamily N-acetyltransferase